MARISFLNASENDRLLPISITSIIICAVTFISILPNTADCVGVANNKETTPQPAAKKYNGPKRCIVCNSAFDESCDKWDGFNFIRPCNNSHLGPTSCRKIVQSVLGKTEVVRQCSNVASPSQLGCIDRVGTYKIKVRYCHCNNEDICNSAPGISRLQMQLLLLLPLVSLACGLRSTFLGV